jgi:hypothetical protein
VLRSLFRVHSPLIHAIFLDRRASATASANPNHAARAGRHAGPPRRTATQDRHAGPPRRRATSDWAAGALWDAAVSGKTRAPSGSEDAKSPKLSQRRKVRTHTGPVRVGSASATSRGRPPLGLRPSRRCPQRTPIKEMSIDQGRTHAEERSNHVRLPLIGGERAPAARHGRVGWVGLGALGVY